MKPWITLDTTVAPGGGTLALCRRDDEYVIRIDGRDLMSSRTHGSEVEHARRGCAKIQGRPRAAVLIGGLGMGYTLRATLDLLPPDARVVVAEFAPAVVRWNRDILSALAGAPLADPRVEVAEQDVAELIAGSSAAFDAVLLDVDNGPSALTAPANAALYGARGLAQTAKALRPGGVFGVWSAGDDSRFTARLERAGFDTTVDLVPAHGKKGRRYAVWVATKRR